MGNRSAPPLLVPMWSASTLRRAPPLTRTNKFSLASPPPHLIRDYTGTMTEETAKTIADYLLTQTEQEYATTCKVLAAVPAEPSDYKPSEKCMSGLALASHIAMAEAFFLRGVINGAFEWKNPEFQTPAEALAFYEATVPGLIGEARALPAAKLAQPLTMGPWTQPAVDFLSFNLRHGIHHRGQLSAYLRPMGAKVPAIYGPSADTKQATAS